MLQFDHEKLAVYHLALEFVSLADEIAGDLADKRSGLADQLRRASTSIVLNIAEGAGEFSAKEKARFYRMALRSTTECAAVLDVCRMWKLFEPRPLLSGRDSLLRIASMLIKLVKSVGQRDEGQGKGEMGKEGKESGTGRGTGAGTDLGRKPR